MATRSTTKDDDGAPTVTATDADATADAKAGDGKAGSGKSGTAYLNTTTGPVVYDKEGHQVDAADWTPEINLDAIGKAARKAGHLKPASEL